MTIARRVAAAVTLALSLETMLLASTVACPMPADSGAAAMAEMDMAGMDMAGMDMTPSQPQPGDDASRSGRETQCSFPGQPPRDCHEMQACAPLAIAALAVMLQLEPRPLGAVVPRPLAGPRSLAHTPDTPPPRA